MLNTTLNYRSRWMRTARWVALLAGVPLAVLGGARTVTWAAATLKVWTSGETLTAADINANFAAVAAEQTPAKVLAGFNAAVTAGGTTTLGAITPATPQFDLRWAMQHAAASAACAAASPVGDSGISHAVLPKPTGVTCAAACSANTAGARTACRTSIAVGNIMPKQATAYTDVVSLNYNYGCADNQAAYDETKGQGTADGSYTAYCCCYKAP